MLCTPLRRRITTMTPAHTTMLLGSILLFITSFKTFTTTTTTFATATSSSSSISSKSTTKRLSHIPHAITSGNQGFRRAMALAMKRKRQENANRQRQRKLRDLILSRGQLITSGQSPPFMRRRLADDDDEDDYYGGDDAAAGDDGGNVDYGNFGFDATQYSLKYARCQAIESYDDDMAEDEDATTVLRTKRYVVFRLCPTNYCMSGSQFGCDGDFGDYIMSMDEYLEYMVEYNNDRKEDYCDFCEECMKDDERRHRRLDEEADEEDADEEDEAEDEEEADEDEEEEQEDNEEEDADEEDEAEDEEEAEGGDDAAAGDDAGEADDAAAAGDDAGEAGDDAGEAGDDAAAGDDAVEHNCAYYNECYDYENICEDDKDDDGYVEYEEFLDCVEYEGQDGSVYYIGPHCASDGASIVLGIYEDKYCSRYVGESIDISDFTGMNVQSDGLIDYYPTDCISCKDSELPYKQDGDEDAVSEICENLFDQSAKCHKYYNNPVYMSEEQESNENKVCYFIDNVLSGSYDEYGQIFISDGSIIDSFQHADFSDVTTSQAVAIVVSLFACLFLIGYSCYLHRAITRKAPWRPRRGGPEALAGQISRQNSGIVMGRSRSGGSYHGGSLA